MDISLSGFLQSLANPVMLATVVLTLGVIFVNSWTDTPNAITTTATIRGIAAKPAIIMSTVFNFLGVLMMIQINANVAETVPSMVGFGGDAYAPMTALITILFSIIAYNVGASIFGIPTSESHSLIAGLTGMTVATQGSFRSMNRDEWIRVSYGMVLSLVLGLVLNWIICKCVILIYQSVDHGKTDRFFSGTQIAGVAVMSFMHGAQSGQEFIGALLLGVAFVNGQPSAISMMVPVWLMMPYSTTIGVGISVGGKKIIKSVGMDMAKLEPFQGLSSDLAGAIGILISTLYGIPISTTHARTSSVMGIGAVKRLSSINLNVVKDIAPIWTLIFPGCGFIVCLMAKLFLLVF